MNARVEEDNELARCDPKLGGDSFRCDEVEDGKLRGGPAVERHERHSDLRI